jgi:hypothetical protein
MGVPPSVGPPKTGRTREDFATLPSPVPFEIEEAVMPRILSQVLAHWPKTPSGNLFLSMIVLGIAPIVIWVAVILSGPLVWASLAVVGLMGVALYIWRRRVEAARERAWVGAFSFGDVVARMRARETRQIALESN